MTKEQRFVEAIKEELLYSSLVGMSYMDGYILFTFVPKGEKVRADNNKTLGISVDESSTILASWW